MPPRTNEKRGRQFLTRGIYYRDERYEGSAGGAGERFLSFFAMTRAQESAGRKPRRERERERERGREGSRLGL